MKESFFVCCLLVNKRHKILKYSEMKNDHRCKAGKVHSCLLYSLYMLKHIFCDYLKIFPFACSFDTSFYKQKNPSLFMHKNNKMTTNIWVRSLCSLLRKREIKKESKKA